MSSCQPPHLPIWSQPARAVWIEIHLLSQLHSQRPSQPARAVWIEMPGTRKKASYTSRHSLRGLCGLKFGMGDYHVYSSSHSLRGLCGLKYPVYIIWGRMPESQPARAVWIEICTMCTRPEASTSQPARAVWIEISKTIRSLI